MGGFSCRLFLADAESAFLGHQGRSLCPAEDLQRYLRYGYPADESVFCITFDLRMGHGPSASDVEEFVVYEAESSGFDAECLRRWRYGLGCLLFNLKRRKRTTP